MTAGAVVDAGPSPFPENKYKKIAMDIEFNGSQKLNQLKEFQLQGNARFPTKIT